MGLQTRHRRLAMLEAPSAQAVSAERTTRWQPVAAQQWLAPHIRASEPGVLVCVDTFPGPTTRAGYIGKLKAAGWPLRRILSDQGNEYRGVFDKVCGEHGIRHTRTKPRHAWTKGFVERLQGSILSELWRTPALHRTQSAASVEFRRRFFSATAMQAALDRYLDFYNHRRPHQGYRTQGRTPGDILLTCGGRADKRQPHQSVNTRTG